MAIEPMEEITLFLMYFALNLIIINICLILLHYEDYCSDTHEMPYILLKILAGSTGGFTIINSILILIRYARGKSMARYICMIAPLEFCMIVGWSIATLVSMFGGHEDDCGASALSIMATLLVYWMLITGSKHNMYRMYAVEMMREGKVVTEVEVSNESGVIV